MNKLSVRSADLSVFIGRFQPYHNGHQTVVQAALKRSHNLLVLIGSANEPRSVRNPFTVDERIGMISSTLTAEERDRVIFRGLEDSAYNLADWVKNVQALVEEAVEEIGLDKPKISLIGHSKDASSYYLKLFPQFDNIDVKQEHTIDATNIRNVYFSNADAATEYLDEQSWKELPESVGDFLGTFLSTPEYGSLVAEYDYVRRYKEEWAAAPYPPVFVTADACVIQSGHILLIKRKTWPGKGLFALPGGFVNQDEYIQEGMLRELREETKLKVPKPVLRGAIVTSKVFDAPHRSSRGRTITHGFLIHLEPDTELPKVQGSDDAEKAFWMPLADLRRDMFFEDHFSIISHFVAML